MTKPVITVDKLSKAYRIGAKEEVPDTLVGAMKGIVASPLKNFRRLSKLDTSRMDAGAQDVKETLWALKDVSFEVNEGDVVGIIGRNGAGKSTLLKILSRITEPTSGRAVIRGRVSSLLEVGTGFHPELTGRENVYMNGTILGMTKREIDRKFDEIVDFSGVEKFLDTPTKRYSSGMQVRLAFAVAAHLEPEILIIDEVLAVGDAEFQKKCLGKMQDVAQGGRTVLFVSHNMAAVSRLCRSALVISSGRASEKKPSEEAIVEYLGQRETNHHADLRNAAHELKRGCSPLIESLSIRSNGNLTAFIKTCDEVEFVIGIGDTNGMQPLRCGLVITDSRENRIVVFHSRYHSSLQLSPGTPRYVSCHVPSLPLVPGQYNVDVVIGDSGGVIDRVANAITIAIESYDVFGTGELPRPGQGQLVVKSMWREQSARLGGDPAPGRYGTRCVPAEHRS